MLPENRVTKGNPCYKDVTRVTANRPIYRCGSFKTFYVHKHGTEIIEVEVWPHIVACYRRESFKVTNILWKVDTNLQYTSRNTHLVVF